MATSPGPRGGLTVLEAGADRFARMGAREVITFSLPSFQENFKEGKMVNETLFSTLKEKISKFENAVNN